MDANFVRKLDSAKIRERNCCRRRTAFFRFIILRRTFQEKGTTVTANYDGVINIYIKKKSIFGRHKYDAQSVKFVQ